MALKKTRNLKKTTLAIPNAYCRIDAQRFDQPDRLWLQVGVYENEASAKDQDEVPTIANRLDTVEHDLSVANDLNGKANVSMANLYTAIKTLDEWSDAVDA